MTVTDALTCVHEPPQNWIGWKCRNLLLSDARVEIGSGDALCYCGKLFADFGAGVIKVEPPAAMPREKSRRWWMPVTAHAESALSAWLNTNKRSIIADLASPADVATIRTLLGSSDLLLDARLRNHAQLGDFARSVAPIRTGPRHHRISCSAKLDLTAIMRRRIRCAAALLVWFKLVGPIEGPPVLPRDGQIAVWSPG